MRRTTFEEILARDGVLINRAKGSSMRPMLRQDRDLVWIVPPSSRLKKYDVALYCPSPGRYVLHRVLEVRERDYCIRGDNCVGMERGITDGEVLGVLTAFVRDGRKIPVTDFKYRCYVRVWCALYPIRMPLMYLRRCLGRLRRGLWN